MTIFSSNSIFAPITKFIKFFGNKINVVSGANTIASLPLCNIKHSYKQYQRLSIQIPAGQTDYVLSFSMLGLKPTFLAIVPTYSTLSSTVSTNYLKWKYQSSMDPKLSFTDILVLTGTTTNPIPTILIDNPCTTCDVQLEILVGAMDNDYLNDIIASLYLNNLEFTNIQTVDQINSEILAYYNSNNELAGTTNANDIVDVIRIVGQNRLLITDTSANNIVLDFINEYHTLQALSAINWLLLDPANRALPKAADITPPVINYTLNVIGGNITIDLATYVDGTFDKQNFIDFALSNATDDTDGNIVPQITNIIFKEGLTELPNIANIGTYTAYITISDIAGNSTTETVSIDAQFNIIDITPPVMTFTTAVVVDTASITLLDYLNNFTYDNAKVLCILNILDNIDGPIPLSNVNVEFLDNLLVPVNPITTTGTYTINFEVSDVAGNITNESIILNVL